MATIMTRARQSERHVGSSAEPQVPRGPENTHHQSPNEDAHPVSVIEQYQEAAPGS